MKLRDLKNKPPHHNEKETNQDTERRFLVWCGGKRVCLLGLGLENLSLAEYLVKKGIDITVFDKRSAEELGERFEKINKLGVDFRGGKDYLKGISDFDIVFRTPGFSAKGGSASGGQNTLKNFKKSAVFTSPMALFFDLCPAKIIAVTGTKGKGTVVSLCYHVLKHSNKKVWLAGNIGVAPFDFVDKLKSDHFVALELSSFQLAGFKGSPYISVVTNLFPDHLSPADPLNPIYHKNLKEYYGAKANIFLNQKKGSWLVVNKNSHHPLALLKKAKSKIIHYDSNSCYSKNWSHSYLIGRHNEENIAAATEVAKILKIPTEKIKHAVENFPGLEHHLELVAEIKGVKFYNDSASTMPQATLAAARSFDDSIILITGGVNKGYDLKNFARDLSKLWQPIVVILIGQTGPEIYRHLKKMESKLAFSPRLAKGEDIKPIIEYAFNIASEIQIPIVFSPGFASFDMFQNSKDRGKKFKKAVLSLRSV